MKTQKYVESNVLEVAFGYTTADGTFVKLDVISKAEARAFAGTLKTSPELLLALVDTFAAMRDALHRDLVDIWTRLDATELS